jgi:hypothetical protein
MNEETLLQYSHSSDMEFVCNGYSAKIGKYKYTITNNLGEIVLDAQKTCYSFYELRDIILGENR